MPFLELDGIRIHFRLEGEGDNVVVLVNGLADDLDTWMLQVPDLVDHGYKVLTFDNRGVGQSDKPMGPYSTALMAADTKQLVDALSITNFHLVGVSMGGMIAQEYAIRHGSDLASLTLACTYAAPGRFCGRMFQFWQDLAPVMGLSAVMRDVLLWAFTPKFFAERDEDAEEFESSLRFITQPIPAYLSQLAAIQGHDTEEALSTIRTQTLVLAGEEDILIPVSLQRELHGRIPEARWATTPGGHACMWEYPAEFNQSLLSFLDGITLQNVAPS
ncbi:MAG TPA: alpha/beta hydrolase [Mycobacteriales bacterium]|nr:alpha/beta hydrolase [Mycobacteriales bacterium]